MPTNRGTSANDTLFPLSDEGTEILGLVGNDTLYAGDGPDTLDGGFQSDWALYSTRFDGAPIFVNGVQVSLSDGSAVFQLDGTTTRHTLRDIENLEGSDFNDTLTGDGGANQFQGRAGDDSISGAGGDDTIFVGAGNDTVRGGEGNDSLYASTGNATLDGEGGFDHVLFSTTIASDPVFMEGVTIDLSTGRATAQIDGTTYVYVLQEIEEISGSEFDDILSGDANANVLRGRAGNDRILGLAGDDTVFSGSGDDTVNGGAGDDSIYAGEGNATLNGDEGIDRVLFSTVNDGVSIFRRGVMVDLSRGNATAQLDAGTASYSLANFVNLDGSDFADTLTGDLEDNEIQGRSGDDFISGFWGNDTLFAGAGEDTLNGDQGNDSLYAGIGNATLNGGDDFDSALFTTATDGVDVFAEGVVINMSQNIVTANVGGATYRYLLEEIEGAHGSNAADRITGDPGDNELQGRGGDDEILGLEGNDSLYAGDGNDTLDGGAGNDHLYAQTGNATMIGGTGEDWALFGTTVSGAPVFTDGVTADLTTQSATARIDGVSYRYDFDSIEFLSGSAAADRLIGDAGNNRIEGGAGNDTIKGGAGDDHIAGGAGDDVVLYDGASDHFTIRYDAAGNETYIIDRTGAEGTDTNGANRLSFTDTEFTLTADGAAYFTENALTATDFTALVELYIAYFNRAPDADGLNFWTLAFVNGTSLDQAAAFFFDQPETRALYGNDINPAVFVNAVYQNVLGRGADDVGLQFWDDALRGGAVTEGQFIRDFLQGARAEAPSGASAAFVAQQNADRAFLDAKTDIGINFAAIRGMSDVDNANAVMRLFDGTAAGLDAARAAADTVYQQALATDGSGEFLVQLVGLVDDPFGGMG